MTHCVICDRPLPYGRSKYCGDRCYFRSKQGFNKRRYHSDPAFVESRKAAINAWRAANREYYNAEARERYALKKAEKLAAILEKARNP